MTASNSRPETGRAPLTPHRTMFTAEVEQATTELARPAAGLFASGAVAGASIGIVVLLLGVVLAQEAAGGATFRFALGSIYALGFTLAILARTDLFTEYTTISVLPLLTGDASVGAVARLWVLVFTGNLFGGFAVAVLGTIIGPPLEILRIEEMARFARHLFGYPWWVIVLSGVAAGWLMGLLSWLIAGGRDTTSQIIFIWIIGFTIGFLGLHHAITGGVEMLIAALGAAITASEVLYVLAWTTAGNALGGIMFAISIQQAARMGRAAVGDGEQSGRHPRTQSSSETRR